MFPFAVLLTLSLAPFIVAQTNDDSDDARDVAGAKAHFEASAIVPDMLSSFDPSAVLDLDFESTIGDINIGQALTKDQSAVAPKVSVEGANSTVQFTGKYTLAMLDADIVGADNSQGVTRHWLVNGVTIADDDVVFTDATTITDYAGPGPAEGSGAHRYVVLLYNQPDTFIAPADFQAGAGVAKMSLSTYIQDSGLGSLVGATYFTVEEGTATVTVSSTAAVQSSTLAVSASGGSSSGSSGSSGSASGTATSSGSGSQASADADNGASKAQAGLAAAFAAFAMVALV